MAFTKKARQIKDRYDSVYMYNEGAKSRKRGSETARWKPVKKDKTTRAPRKRRFKILKYLFLLVLLAGVIGTGGLALLFYIYSRDLPRLDSLKSYNPPTTTRVYSRRGELIAEYFLDNNRRTLVEKDKIPLCILDAVMAAEDGKFRTHKGLDYWGMVRAMFVNIFSGKVKQGGSTITQQVAKTFLLTPERTLSRKIKEIILARRLEKQLSKEEILYLYLNQIYFGHGRYGIQEASHYYFNKDVSKLNLGEAAMLAGMIKSPGRYSPFRHLTWAKARQVQVLESLLRHNGTGRLYGTYQADKIRKYIIDPLIIRRGEVDTVGQAPYFTSHIRKLLINKMGKKAFYQGNLKIHTTLDLKLHNEAKEALRIGLEKVDRRHGYRGPIKHWQPGERHRRLADLQQQRRPIVQGRVYRAMVTGASRNRATVQVSAHRVVLKKRGLKGFRLRSRRLDRILRRGDEVWVRIVKLGRRSIEAALYQKPRVQGALLSLNPHTREVVAMVGGYDYMTSSFNRALQAKRQPGSAFKPIVYSTALRSGKFTAAYQVVDSPMVYGPILSRRSYRPRNYNRTTKVTKVLLREALARSLNRAALQVADAVGIQSIRDYAKLLGIRSKISKNLAIALGSEAITMAELANAYAVFASGGGYAELRFITKIENAGGVVDPHVAPTLKEVISPEQAYLITNLMRSVIEARYGTAGRLRRLGRPAAGKTGTTNKNTNAWFVGFTPQLLASVWVGHDDRKSIGRAETGGRSAAPIWLDFMKAAHMNLPKLDFKAPLGIEFVSIDPKTGLKAQATLKGAVKEAFLANTAPTQMARAKGDKDPESFLMDEVD